ncbi:hypothetical protein CK203_057292 [Vitis vinifera]|uniref:Uncharacterized protein n=1 Tax=Vitis vinifera TaxID=29760 RepID=A0A438GKJ2_VITVI|nr:hypothetical protein CK203_057292 [Vitis vinifera]
MFVKASLVPYSTFQVPYGYCSNLQNLVSMEDLKLYALKSHDYHTLMQQLLPVSLRSILPKHVRNAICRLSSFFNALCSKVVDVPTLDELQNEFTLGGCTHLKEEGIEFCTKYLSNVEAIGIPSTSNIDQKVGASIFGGHTMKLIPIYGYKHIHYGWKNTTIIQPYVKLKLPLVMKNLYLKPLNG